MIRGIDHLVIAAPDLKAAARSYAELGFDVVPGGKHPPATGTHNALIGLADGSYLELIAFYQPNAEHRWWDALQRGGGLVDVCLQSDALEADAAAFRAAGVDMTEPISQSRARPDGFQVRWTYALARGPHRGVAPFLIRDETARSERVPQRHAHPNGVTGIGTLTVAVDDLDPVRAWYARALGQPGEAARRDDLQAEGVRFRTGPHLLELLAPRGEASPLAAWLRARGPSPYAATLTTRGGAVGPLDEAKTLGTRLALV